MWKLSNAVLDYFDDNERFANLFNGRKQASNEHPARDKAVTRTRDIKKRLKENGTLRVLAVEDQNLVDYMIV